MCKSQRGFYHEGHEEREVKNRFYKLLRELRCAKISLASLVN
jgi:hypothetical protein